MDWQNVWIYISTSYPDMHAEREYLMKEVEPELASWCRERRLDLHMVDLRWGISEADVEHNIRALRVCLENIDRCRPFFVGFLGQHRGWVPGPDDVDAALLKEYDGLEECLGKYSLQEIEILHGMLRPLKKGKNRSVRGLLYDRSDDFQRELLKEQPKWKPVFTNEPIRKGLFSKENKVQTDAQEAFRKEAEKQVTIVRYQARWDRSLPSPELKEYYGRDLSAGRLYDFQILGKSLKDHLIAYLKAEIIREFPERKEACGKRASERPARDLQEQELFFRRALSKCSEGGVPEEMLAEFLQCPVGSRILLSSRAGIGKTAFLAKYIEEKSRREDSEVYYRFFGAGSDVVTLQELAMSVYLEIMQRIGLSDDWLPRTERELMVRWPEALKLAGLRFPVVLVIDGLRESDVRKASWVFEYLPEEVTVVAAVRSEEAERLTERIGGTCRELMPVNDPKIRKKLIRQAVSGLLKNVDEEEMNLLLNSQGSANPLFVEAAVNELRYATDLEQWKQLASGETGISARAVFHLMFQRMEAGDQCYVAKPELEVKAFLGFLAASRTGLSAEQYPQLVLYWAETEAKKIGTRRLKEDFRILLKQVEPFLVFDGQTCRPLQESFVEAIREYYRDGMSEFHRILAAVYYDRCDKYGDNSFRSTDPEAFREVIYHSAKGRWEWVLSLLKDPAFLTARMKNNGILALIEDYEKIDVRLSPKYQQICRLLWLAMPVLEEDPDQLEAQIMIRRGADPEPVFDEMLEKLKSLRRGWFLSPLQKYGQNLDDFDQLEEAAAAEPSHRENEMLGLYQSNGSLYLFSREYSVAVSPLTLQIRKTGVPVQAYLPEVLRKKYLLHWDTKESTLMLYNLETLQNDLVRPIPREVTEKIESAWWDEKDFVVMYRSLAGKGTVRIFPMEGVGEPEAYVLEKAQEHTIVNDESGTYIWETGSDEAEWKLLDLKTGETLCEMPKEQGIRVRDAFYKNGRIFYIREEKEEVSLCCRNRNEKGERPEHILHSRPSGEGLYFRGRQSGQALYQNQKGDFLVCDLAEEKISGEYSLTKEEVTACRFEKNLLYAVLANEQLCVFDLTANRMQCRAFLEAPVRKMLMTGAGLVTIWNEKNELLSFQLQKKR